MGLLDDLPTRVAVEAERALLNGTGGGCRSPIGVIGTRPGDRLELIAAAERTWVPAAGATVRRAPWAGSAARAPADERRDLAARLAAQSSRSATRPRVLVARPEGQAGPLLGRSPAAGVEAVHVPAIEIRAAPAGGDLDAAVGSDARRHRRRHQRQRRLAALDAIDPPRRDPAAFRWAAVGEATAVVLRAGASPRSSSPPPPTPRPSPASCRSAPATGSSCRTATSPTRPSRRPCAARRRRHARSSPTRRPRPRRRPARCSPRRSTTAPSTSSCSTSGSTARGLLALAADAARAAILATPVVAAGATTARRLRGRVQPVLEAPAPDAASLAAFTARGPRRATRPTRHRRPRRPDLDLADPRRSP